MNPQEILPSPEISNDSDQEQSTYNEKTASQKVETRSPIAQAGMGVMTATAVGQAQAQITGVTGTSNIAQSSDDMTQDDADVDMPSIADDIDLIEKEWVKKAKDIVDQTIGDPYTQHKKINKMKVEYVKKRYNKVLKTQE